MIPRVRKVLSTSSSSSSSKIDRNIQYAFCKNALNFTIVRWFILENVHIVIQWLAKSSPTNIYFVENNEEYNAEIRSAISFL